MLAWPSACCRSSNPSGEGTVTRTVSGTSSVVPSLILTPVGYKYSIMSLRTALANIASAKPAVHDRIATVFSSLLYMALRRLLGILSSRNRAAGQVELENLVLRHQVAILRRQVKRPVYRMRDRALLAAASRILPRERWNAFLVRPETIMRWHKGLVARK